MDARLVITEATPSGSRGVVAVAPITAEVGTGRPRRLRRAMGAAGGAPRAGRSGPLGSGRPCTQP
jgi:hypothetical protein